MKTALFSLIIAVAVAIMSVFQFEKYQKLTTTMENALQQLKTENKNTQTYLEAELNKTKTQILSETTKHENNQTDRAWALAKIDYLVRQAALRLQLERDVKTTKLLLKSALEHIQTLNEPQLFRLHETLTREVNALDAVKLPNLEDLWLKVGLLIEQVPTLTLASIRTSEPKPVLQSPSELSPAEEPSWQDALKKSLADMKDIVKIRKHAKPIEPLLADPEIFYEKQRLSLMLEEIRFAILVPKPLVYQHMLKETLIFLQSFEQKEEKMTKMHETLSELSLINLQPELPNLIQSLEQLRLLQE